MEKKTKQKSSLCLTVFSLFALFSGSCVAKPPQENKTEEPRNVELTNAAWAAYENKNYEAAITAAMRCVERFKKEADRNQAELEKKHADEPPTGKVTAEQKKTIFEQGVLNDVATCYWIAGHSAQLLQKNDQARDAYLAAAKYTYARTYDTKQHSFWSPAEDAADRLKDIPVKK